MFQLNYVKGDLFTSDDPLAHCVSADLSMSAGIAVEFKKRFGRPQIPPNMTLHVNTVITTYDPNNPTREILHLVTKEKYYHKPTLASMELTIENLHKTVIDKGISRLSMPRIGCGLDGLSWPDVEQLLKNFFHDVPLTITVYHL